ncbi:MAG: PHP domain-containing protein [Chloroflexi bacterium]|nr:PHP domain-containing protein [Chloroflexota bacterium]
MKYDLHLHTTASDGRLSPSALVNLARERGLEVIAITDHDSVGGISEALETADQGPGIVVIPGVEINTDLASGELHILGYFIDYRDADLALALEKIRESRVGRAQKMVEKLKGLGMPVEWSRVQEMAHGESICRPHIAQALLEKGFVGSEREAFDKYIWRDGPAYVEREKVQPADAVRIIKAAKGLPVLAHPADIKDLNSLIIDLKDAGLVGLEAYYGQYDANTVKRMVRLANEHGLLTTGGSDYHHFGDDREVPLGTVYIPEESINALFKSAGRMEERKKK